MNNCQLDLINTTFNFKMSCYSHSDFLKLQNDPKRMSKFKTGDVIYVSGTDDTYVFIDNKFENITGPEESIKVENTGKIVSCNCTHCGAPLTVDRYATIIKCEYCGSSYRIEY